MSMSVNGSHTHVSSRFACFLCGAICSTETALRGHEIQEHSVFRCPHSDCEQSFPNHMILQVHDASYHKVFTCSICMERIRGSAMIHEHLREKHSQSVPFTCICETCGLFFQCPSDQASHSLSTHRTTASRMGYSKPVKIGFCVSDDVWNKCSSNNCYSRNAELGPMDDLVIQQFVDELLNVNDPLNTYSICSDVDHSLAGKNLYQFDPVD
jgi:hypothetical protein